MTVEVAVLNTRGVALAADSAITYHLHSSEKGSNFENKIFMLPSKHSVGIMYSGTAGIMGMCWDGIFSRFNDSLGERPYSSLEAYARRFIEFLPGNEELKNSENQQTVSFISNLSNEIDTLIDNFGEKLGEENVESDEDQKLINKLLRDVIDVMANCYDNLETLDHLKNLKFKDLKNNEIIEGTAQKIMEKFTDTEELPKVIPEQETLDKLKKLVIKFFVKDTFHNEEDEDFGGTRMVFAGYGEKEMFPSICEVLIDIFFINKLKYEIICDKGIVIGVRSYGHHDMIDTYTRGISPQFLKIIERYIDDVFSRITDNTARQIPGEFKGYLWNTISEEFIIPTRDSIALFSKKELAQVAEKLVDLEIFKQKMFPSPDVKTVSEPIDVAVISKEDGFVWIKRKSYFDPQLNPQLMDKK